MSDAPENHTATGGYSARVRGEGDYGYSPPDHEEKGFQAPPPSAQLPPPRDPGPADAPGAAPPASQD